MRILTSQVLNLTSISIMKTLESILKSISIENDCCNSCKVKEGAEHPIKGLIVQLNSIPGDPDYIKYCQICLIHHSKKTQKEKKKDMIQLVKKFGMRCSVLLINLLIFTELALAQPGLPGDPAQAPIDGGLGLLAAAGGAYAYKKLRGNKNDELD